MCQPRGLQEEDRPGFAASLHTELVHLPFPATAMRRFLLFLVCAGGCTTVGPVPGDPLSRRGDEISVCGQLFHTGTRVVLWNDPAGYDAYRLEPRFRSGGEDNPGARYGSFRRQLPAKISDQVRERGWTLEELGEVVHLFVLHYDVAGTSRRCFEILHDQRNLSVHFMLDTDGTIYQTLDLKERAWHATIANDHSVGIEIAHPGAYPSPDHDAFATWYGEDAEGLRMLFPDSIGDPGLMNPDSIPRPARSEQVQGPLHGRDYWQFDFTPQQYLALASLTATLSRVFPRIRLRAPRGPDGSVSTGHLEPDELHAFEGVLGHSHVQTNKQDPGPAFQWDLLLENAKGLVRSAGSFW